jgi:hypothetical protein
LNSFKYYSYLYIRLEVYFYLFANLHVKNVSPLFVVPLPHNSASMLAFHKGSSWAHWGRGGPVRPNYFDFDLGRYISSTTFPCLKQKTLFSASHKFYYDIQYDMKAYIDLMEMFHAWPAWLTQWQIDYLWLHLFLWRQPMFR